MKQLTLELLQDCTGAPFDKAVAYFDSLCDAMGRFNIVDEAVPMFLAHVAIESNRLTQVEESLYYRDPERIARIYLRMFDANHDRKIEPEEIEAAKPYVCNHAAMSKLLYQGYHGRGLIQLTFKANYQAASDALGFDYVGNPNLVLQPTHAALTAAWFFQSKGCIEVSDDITECTRIINPALMHLAERKAQWERNVQVLA